jgi:hypothetical protein
MFDHFAASQQQPSTASCIATSPPQQVSSNSSSNSKCSAALHPRSNFPQQSVFGILRHRNSPQQQFVDI